MLVKDLNQKKGAVLYKAMYVNQAANRSRAVFDGTFRVFDGTTVRATVRRCMCPGRSRTRIHD